ncbi:MAG TPA: glucokinase [Thermoanaerobaculia bacterium]|nr:glucokinase [Thermoanaerobaculia bacterium]
MRTIAGDIGGTKTLLRCIEDGAVVVERRFESVSFVTFDALLGEFFRECGPGADAACLAVAGPVFENRAEVTNLKWDIDAAALAKAFAIGRVALINDFYAIALGVPLLGPDDRLPLHEGTRRPREPIAILGAGTGLGEAAVIWSGDQWNVVPSEGGHADYAPQDEEQTELFLFLRKQYGHVSWERLLSGMGLVNIFTFLGGASGDPAHVAALAESGDPLGMKTFHIFVDIYGAEAGNMALRVLARGGVYLAGGVAAKNTKFFTDGRFVTAFLRKGRFTEVLEEMPIDLITDEKVGLRGAAEMARRVAAGQGPGKTPPAPS